MLLVSSEAVKDSSYEILKKQNGENHKAELKRRAHDARAAVRIEKVLVVAHVRVAAFALDVRADADLNVTTIVRTTANVVIANSSTLNNNNKKM